MRFTNRADAGRRLAAVLRSRAPSNPVVVGVVRGGVPVAAEVARGLGAPLDICVVRNLVVPAHKPVVIGAVAERRAAYLDPARIARFALGDDEVEHLMAKQFEEVDRLTQILRTTQPIDLTGRDVILVDDGVLTGATIRAAIRSVRRRARSVELAVPVGPTEAIERLRPFVDRLVCLVSAHSLVAIGARYDRFEPVSEAEVLNVLAAQAREPARIAAGDPAALISLGRW